MKNHVYTLLNAEEIESPSLIYYKSLLQENAKKTIETAGGAARLWPHVKSHKSADITKLLLDMGVTRFKCATIAEAEMLAETGAKHILLAYPLAGPNIRRYAALMQAYPKQEFYAIGDDPGQLALLGAAAKEDGRRARVFLDVNMGMNRTGVAFERVVDAYAELARLSGIWMLGLHCYDGHNNMNDPAAREAMAREACEQVEKLRQALILRGLSCGLIVLGGTPTLPFYAQHAAHDWFMSPGTAFLYDAAHRDKFGDLGFTPAAAVLARVVSHPSDGLFTIDVGSKAISTDTGGPHGIIVGLEKAKPVLQSEEHWVFQVEAKAKRPSIGTVLYVLPAHICPTNALYPFALVAEDGRITEEWPITARNRRITY